MRPNSLPSKIRSCGLLVLGLLAAVPLAGCGSGGGGGGGTSASLAGRLSLDDGGGLFKRASVVRELEPNDRAGSGQDLGILEPGASLTIHGRVDAAADPRDGFRVLAPERCRVTATVVFDAAVDSDVDLVAFDPIGLAPLATFRGATSPEGGSFLAKGTFDVVVEAARGASDYALTLTAEAVGASVAEGASAGAPRGLGEILPGDRLVVTGTLGGHPGDVRGSYLVACPTAVRLTATVTAAEGAWAALSAFDAAGAPLALVGVGGASVLDVAGATLVRIDVEGDGRYALTLAGLDLPAGTDGVRGDAVQAGQFDSDYR